MYLSFSGSKILIILLPAPSVICSPGHYAPPSVPGRESNDDTPFPAQAYRQTVSVHSVI